MIQLHTWPMLTTRPSCYACASRHPGIPASRHCALAGGVTTIRDLGDRDYVSLTLRDWFRSTAEVGPTILTSGPPITVTGGHCWVLGGEADGEEGDPPCRAHARGPRRGPDQDHGHRRQHDSVARSTRITVHGHRTVGRSGDSARRPRSPPTRTAAKGIADAMAAGVDSIEHCTFFTADGIDADPDVIAELGCRQAVVSVTGGAIPGSTTPYPAIAKRLVAIQANHAALHKAGARIVCGTDAGVGQTKPHDVLRYAVSALPPSG